MPLSRRWQRPELRPGGLRGRRLRCCGSLLRGSLRSCQGHLLWPASGIWVLQLRGRFGAAWW